MKTPTEQFDLGLGEGDGEALPNSATQRTQPTASVPASTPTELFNAHLDFAGKIARSFKTTRNTADHDDLDQAALLALHRASQAFRPEAGREFAPYAGQSVRNALNDFYRKTRRIGKREAFSLDAPALAGGSGEAGGDGDSWKDNWQDVEADIASLEAASHESAELLRQAIAELLPQQRAVVEAVLAGRTFSEIAEERGVTKQAANNTYQRALVQIKAELLAMGVKGFESSAGVLHETPARYRFTLNSARVSTDGLEKPVLGSETQGAVDSPTAEAPVPVSPAPAVVPIPAPLAEAMPPITPAAKGWWARLLGWWRSRR
jgi:RNA polymerase sigma factor (sigma-70 family)